MARCSWRARTTLYRVTLEPGVPQESRREVVVDGLPTGGHSTKTVEVLPDGDLLLSIGSSCDVCEEEDGRRAAMQRGQAGGDDRVSMRGLRNAVGLWVDDATGRAWATDMGRDRLGDDRPPETLYEVVDGADAGWPRCHAGDLPDPRVRIWSRCLRRRGGTRRDLPGAHGAARPGRLGGSPGDRVPRLMELIAEGRLRGLVAALGRWPCRRPASRSPPASCGMVTSMRSAGRRVLRSARTARCTSATTRADSSTASRAAASNPATAPDRPIPGPA